MIGAAVLVVGACLVVADAIDRRPALSPPAAVAVAVVEGVRWVLAYPGRVAAEVRAELGGGR